MALIILYGDIFHEGNTTIIGAYTTFQKARAAYFKAIEEGYTNIKVKEVTIDD